jgi:Flp pilus assembly secretin CpaC
MGGVIPFVSPNPGRKVIGAVVNSEILPLQIPGLEAVPGLFGVPLIQITGTDSILGLGISIVATETETKTRLLQSPSITVAVGEEAELFVGDNVPIPVAASASDELNLTFGPTLRTNIERQDIGTRLRVRPILSGDDSLMLELHLENKLIRPIGSLETGPVISNRTLDTKFTAGFGRRMVIAGLNGEVSDSLKSGSPFLSKIPIIGRFFTVSVEASRKTYLLISVEAQLLPTSEEKQASAIAIARAVERLDREFEHDFDFEPHSNSAYVVRAGSYYKRDTAEAAEQLLMPEVDPWPTSISRRNSKQGERFDLFVLDLKNLAEVAEISLALERAGMAPEIVPLTRNSVSVR